jgi:hypothetical protein
MSFADARKAAEREGMLGSSDYLKIKEGGNRIRILTNFIPHPSEFKGRKTFKWIGYVIDRSDGQVKPYFMPHTIYKILEDLQESEDYSFDEPPMPYDLTITAKGAGTIDVEYSVMPAKKETPLTPEERNALDAMKPLEELRAALRAKNEGPKTEAKSNGFDPDEIPV